MPSSPNIVIDPPKIDKWESEDEFEARLQRIQSAVPAGGERSESSDPSSEEVSALKSEIKKLKQLVDEARRRVSQLEEEAVRKQKRDQELEQMLEEKSDQVRELEKQVEEFKSKQSSGVTEEELVALHGELENERKMLEEDRLAMEEQFRQLELGMARERAEIARERNEMARTKNEMKHKLDLLEKAAQIEASPLRRLRDELIDQSTGHNAVMKPGSPNLPMMPNLPVLNRKAPEGENQSKRSGLISRFMGKKD